MNSVARKCPAEWPWSTCSPQDCDTNELHPFRVYGLQSLTMSYPGPDQETDPTGHQEYQNAMTEFTRLSDAGFSGHMPSFKGCNDLITQLRAVRWCWNCHAQDQPSVARAPSNILAIAVAKLPSTIMFHKSVATTPHPTSRSQHNHPPRRGARSPRSEAYPGARRLHSTRPSGAAARRRPPPQGGMGSTRASSDGRGLSSGGRYGPCTKGACRWDIILAR